jgi:hypothetical protein
VTIRADEAIEEAIVLEPKPATLFLTSSSELQGFLISIDGKGYGSVSARTLTLRDLLAGSRRLELLSPDGTTKVSDTLSLERGKQATYSVGADRIEQTELGKATLRLSGPVRTTAPRVRMGATTVSGRLPKEVIQRIVRQNFARFRLCYEKALAANANLQGRITVRFVIRRDGKVSNVGSVDSDFPDPGMVKCIALALYDISFPEPEGGFVTVVYPVVFEPG